LARPPPFMTDRTLNTFLAALLDLPWTERALVARAKAAMGRSHRFVPSFVRRVLAAFPDPTHFDRLAAFAANDAALLAAWKRAEPTIVRMPIPKSFLAPLPVARDWNVPSLTTDRELCDLLRIDPHQLAWLADIAGRNGRERSEKLRHYRQRWIAKASGGHRLLEIPKQMLMAIQERILHGILDRIPPHEAAHGFRIGRSIRTHAGPHAGRAVVIGMDLRDFFPSVSLAAIHGPFRTAGYPPNIAGLLVGLCTTKLPRSSWDARPNPAESDWADGVRFLGRHLPQGAPTSPALANLAAFDLDVRLAAYARSLDLEYTRYADDLAFSGGADFAGRTKRFVRAVEAIIREEGFRVQAGKTRVQSRAQRQTVAGVVVNVRPSVPRDEYDRLKAILVNCLRHGPESQNRENHPRFRDWLNGKVSHVAMLNPIRGRKLLALFDQIAWKSGGPPPTIAGCTIQI
jgi:RNA-directed DNA polymerase